MALGGSIAGFLALAAVVGIVVPSLTSHHQAHNLPVTTTTGGPTSTTSPSGTSPSGSGTTSTTRAGTPLSTSPSSSAVSTTTSSGGPVTVATTTPVTSQPATSQPGTTQPATTQPATTEPVTGQPLTSLPATTQVTTLPATTQVAPVTGTGTPITSGGPATTTVPPNGSGGGGQALSNSVVSVNVPSGWSEDGQSTSTSLVLDGPDGVYMDLSTGQVSGSNLTISQVLQAQANNFEQNTNFSNVSVCQQPHSATVPGSPQLSGEQMNVCFTITPQNGASEQYVALEFDALLTATSSQLVVNCEIWVPGALSNAQLNQVVGPVVSTIHWLQVSGG